MARSRVKPVIFSKAALTSMMLQSASVMTMPSLLRSMMRAASRRRASAARRGAALRAKQDAVGGSFDTGDAEVDVDLLRLGTRMAWQDFQGLVVQGRFLRARRPH